MNKNDVFEKLKKFVAIRSVSTDPTRRDEIIKAAEFIKKELQSMAFDTKLIVEKNSHPLVVGKKIIDKSLPTIALYAHYDVQPEDPVGKWTTPPFELTRRGEKLFGRGVADDKMHLIQSITAAANLIKKNQLKNNVVFLFEGEEEKGSDNFEKMVKEVKKDLEKVDVFYILDVGMKSKNAPQIYYGLRGIIGFELTVRMGKSDLHSGVYGNRVSNPALVACQIMSAMKDLTGQDIIIPGFYKTVREFSGEEINILSKHVPNAEEEKKHAQVKELTGGFLDSKIRPSIEINGISSGYTGKGFKTIIPAEARVKFSVRLVEHQKGTEIAEIIKKFVADEIPSQVDYELKMLGSADPFFTDYNNPHTQKTAEILEEVFGNECLFNRSGGSIPAAEILQRLFKKPIILLGFTLPDENLHAPDENVDVEMFGKGIVTLEKILSVA